MKTIIFFFSCLVLACVFVGGVGCKSVDPVSGVPVYDPVKTAKVEAAVSQPIKTGVHVILSKNRAHAPEIAAYLGEVRGIFCRMAEEKRFSYEFLVSEANKLGTPALMRALEDDPDTALLVLVSKDSVIALYGIFLADKGAVELSDEAWGSHVSTVFCQNLTTALKDEGF
jgi:hypothetical protein